MEGDEIIRYVKRFIHAWIPVKSEGCLSINSSNRVESCALDVRGQIFTPIQDKLYS
jgi:hypothetical protein